MSNVTNTEYTEILAKSSLAQALLTVGIDLESALPKKISEEVWSSLQTKSITNDSRHVAKNDVFCAVKGHNSDGRDFIKLALSAGASVILKQCDTRAEHGAIVVGEANQVIIDIYALNEQLFLLTQAYYQTPQKNMNVVGITGTNGKTSTALILAQLLQSCQQKTGVIGTVGQGIFPQLTPIQNTTPGATELFDIIEQFKQNSSQYIAMEVSSHALDQKRVLPELFNVAVFTNLSRDHLDYHENMAAYADAKFSLFNSKKPQHVVINGDDKYAQTWLKNSTKSVSAENKLVVFGKNTTLSQTYPQSYVIANKLTHSVNGLQFNLKSYVGDCQINSPLLGDFNVDNLLAAIAVLIAQDFTLIEIQQAISELKPIVGRMETFSSHDKPLSIVDYAHTPDGLKNALIASQKHSETSAKLWLMFGCGGDRDTGKRAEMGSIAEQYADHIVLTNDNPRTEAPQDIFNDILKGIKEPSKVSIIANRAQAVNAIFQQTEKDDCILFAGKGHEEYIFIGDKKEPYNERELVKTYYQEAVL